MLRRVSLSAVKLFILSLAAAALAAVLIFLYHQRRLGPSTGTADGATHTQYIVFFAWSELLGGVAIHAASCWLVALVWHGFKGRLHHP